MIALSRRGFLGVMALAALGPAARADEADRDEVLLTVGGAIRNKGPGGKATFTRAQLEALPARKVVTRTPWTKGATEFVGVSLDELMRALGGEGTVLHTTALNDYAVDLPMSDATPSGALTAYLMDGKPMSVREKGPLWIIYPFDDNPEYRSEKYYSRSAWQLAAIEVR